jgi:cell division protein FtsN
VAAPQQAPTQRSGNCPGASAFSQQFINNGSKFPVRCGPQAEKPVTLPGEDTSSLGTTYGGQNQRIVPRHVYVNRQNTRNVQVPDGYRAVWNDGRLNPNRAEQTAQGNIQSQRIWRTNRVPSRANDPTNRQPKVVAPRVVTAAQAGLKAAPAPTISTKNQTSAKAVKPAATARYVQIGTFGVAANAQATAQRMARTGLPVRMGKLTRGGKSYNLVLAGPFATQAQTSSALNIARRAGFSDAFVRK